jgi:hypothetical protein
MDKESHPDAACEARTQTTILRIKFHPDGDAITLKTHFTVPYVEWGLKDPSVLVLGVNKTVDIDVEATAQTTALH